jgi:tRNA1(Val) A37 N6-methylase TrmN6
VCGLGVEIQSDLAGWAQSNIEANAFGDRLSVIVGDVMDVLPDRQVDHAFANPPWHDEFSSRSAMPGRDVARRREAGLVESWARAMTRRLRHRGTVTLILPASCVHVGLAALAGSGCGAVALYPLWPKPHKPARIILLQGIYRARGADRILPGLVVHAPQEGYTPEAEAILRGGDALDLGR